MQDIITNKRKIPEAEISTMLANYTFKDGVPKKLGDPGIPTIPCSIKRNYVKTALCDLGASVSVMPLSLYKGIIAFLPLVGSYPRVLPLLFELARFCPYFFRRGPSNAL